MKEAICLNRQKVHHGKVIEVSVDRVQLPNQHIVDLDIVHHPGAAAVVAINTLGQVVLIRQMRYASGEWLLEVPAGKRDNQETPLGCATRELAEETGYHAQTWIDLGFIWTTPGFCNERIWLFLALDLQQTQQSLDEDELLTLEIIPFSQAVSMAQQGQITDAKTMCALLRAHHHLQAN